MQVHVYRLVRMDRKHDLSSVEQVRGLHWLVELSAVTGEEGLQATEERLTRTARALEPFVHASKHAPTE